MENKPIVEKSPEQLELEAKLEYEAKAAKVLAFIHAKNAKKEQEKKSE